MRSRNMLIPLCLALSASAATSRASEPPLPASPGRGFFMRPAIRGDRLMFVSEGDLWSARLPADLSGPVEASRLTSGTLAATAHVPPGDGTPAGLHARRPTCALPQRPGQPASPRRTVDRARGGRSLRARRHRRGVAGLVRSARADESPSTRGATRPGRGSATAEAPPPTSGSRPPIAGTSPGSRRRRRTSSFPCGWAAGSGSWRTRTV